MRADEQHATTAVLASTVYVLLTENIKGLQFFPITMIAFLVAFLFRVFAVREHWASIKPYVPPAEGLEVIPPAKS